MTVQVHCPVHEVNVEVWLSTGLGGGPELLEDLSAIQAPNGIVWEYLIRMVR